MNGISVGQLLGKFYVAWVKMEELIDSMFSTYTEDISNINIYLDINSMTRLLYSNLDFNIEEDLLISASIINLCAHYRAFFRKYYNTETYFYLIVSDNLPLINRKLIKGYNNIYFKNITNKKDITEKIKTNLECTKILCEYLPNIYLIPSIFETGVIIYELINKEYDETRAHMILTKDSYNYQLINNKNTFIIRPINKDKSYLINDSNIYKIISQERRIKTILDDNIIPSNLYTILLTLIGSKDRCIKSKFNIRTAFNIMKDGIDSKILSNQNPNLFFERIKNVNSEELKNRYKSIDLFQQNKLYKLHNEYSLLNGYLLDKYNPQEVREICSKYYLYDPIDLERL